LAEFLDFTLGEIQKIEKFHDFQAMETRKRIVVEVK